MKCQSTGFCAAAAKKAKGASRGCRYVVLLGLCQCEFIECHSVRRRTRDSNLGPPYTGESAAPIEPPVGGGAGFADLHSSPTQDRGRRLMRCHSRVVSASPSTLHKHLPLPPQGSVSLSPSCPSHLAKPPRFASDFRSLLDEECQCLLFCPSALLPSPRRPPGRRDTGAPRHG